MKNVLRVLKRDFLRILKAPASIVVVLALIVLLVLAATLVLAPVQPSLSPVMANS